MFGLNLRVIPSHNLCAVAAAGLLTVCLAPNGWTQVDEVDPTIGNVSILLEPTRPTAYLPNSMIRMYPVRKDALDDQIRYFPLTILSHRQPELFAVLPGSIDRPAVYDTEHASPYYYSVRFEDSSIHTEFAPAHQAGYFRFSFADEHAAVTLKNLHAGALHVVGKDVLSGEESVEGMTAYFFAELSAPVSVETRRVQDRDHLTLTARTKVLDFRYGFSFISVEQAKRNLEREIPSWGLERVKAQAREQWNETLGRIAVEGGSEAQRKVFYTALYRCFERMINITEDGRYYSAYDHAVHEDPRPFYVDNWLWDTFRAMEPLQTLLNPDVQADKIQSYVRMYQQSGIMPTFALASGPAAIMNGNHAAPWIIDAWNKGVRDFDLPTAYEGLRKRSLDVTMLPWSLGPRTSLDDFYSAHGYMPALHPGEQEPIAQVNAFEKRQAVAVTLENSTDDWCLAQLAGILHKPEDRELFMHRAANYRNLFRANKSLMWPKDDKGNWIEIDPKFDGGPGGRDYYDENNGWTYTWDVVHDYDGLFTLMGGKEKAQANLDRLFREPLPASRYQFQAKFPDSTSMIGEFSMANEPSLPIPYIYDRLGAPWKTQKHIRTILNAFFPDDLHGIPGDEDGGGLSSFVVFSMMGFYPVTPGIPVYDIGSPIFTKVTIRLKNGKTFTLNAPQSSADNKYVQSVRWNGKPLDRLWLSHKDLTSGGVLDLSMGEVPNTSMGTRPESLPPASMSVDPAQFE